MLAGRLDVVRHRASPAEFEIPTQPMRGVTCCFVMAISAASCVSHPPAASRSSSNAQHSPIVHDFTTGLQGIRTGGPAVKLQISAVDEPILVVDYPPRSSNPAARDVQLDAATTN